MTWECDDDGFDWFGPAREEPHCGSCNDNGCRECQPTRLDVQRRRLRHRLWSLRGWLLRREPDNELPF